MPDSDIEVETKLKQGDLWLGIAWLVTALLAIYFSRSIEALGFGENFDPGPRTFPIGLSALLILGALVELWRSRGTHPADTQLSTPSSSPTEEAATSGNHKTTLIILGCFTLYVILMPLIGFSLSTLAMASLMMKLLGNSFRASVLVSIILISLIYVLFVILFKVPLPGGIFNLPF